MINKYTTTMFAIVISSLVVTSCFAISIAAQAFAQGNQTGGAASSSNNQSSTNSTSGVAADKNPTRASGAVGY
jgi:hypothetical protein